MSEVAHCVIPHIRTGDQANGGQGLGLGGGERGQCG